MTVVEIPPGSGNRYRYEYEGGKTQYKGPVGTAPEMGEEEFLNVIGKGRGEATLLAYEYQENLWSDPIIVYVDKENRHPDPSKLLIWGYDKNGDLVKGDFKRNFTRLKKIRPIKVAYRIPPRLSALQEKEIHVESIKEHLSSS